MEKWDILNADGEPIGKTTLRGKCNLKTGEYHLVVHIWMVSSKGEFLIQRRSENKKLMPGEWAATGGAAISGEDSYTAANRELYEELGIPSNKQTLIKLCILPEQNFPIALGEAAGSQAVMVQGLFNHAKNLYTRQSL